MGSVGLLYFVQPKVFQGRYQQLHKSLKRIEKLEKIFSFFTPQLSIRNEYQKSIKVQTKKPPWVKRRLLISF
jgi:hypothetical protein